VNTKRVLRLAVVLTVVLVAAGALTVVIASLSTPLLAEAAGPQADNPNPPVSPVPPEAASDDSASAMSDSSIVAHSPVSPTSPIKLIFIHHSCGEYWLADEGDDPRAGELGATLSSNNYFVSDTNYEWGPDDADLGYETIGDHTDIGHWYNWFVGPNSITYTTALYNEFGSHSYYTRLTDPDPSRENEIIMFKSCFPNSNLRGDPTADPPPIESNPLRGQAASGNSNHTVANAKGIYIALLNYFETQPDKLFIVITAPPVQDSTYAANARAFNNWLVNDWLDGYEYDNVAVFDFYNVLTSNGGDSNTNDLGQEEGNHHRWWGGAVQHQQTVSSDTGAYPTEDDHPSRAGNLKATGEFVPLLNVYYNRWKAGAPITPTLTLTAPNGGENWTVGSEHEIRWTSTGTITQVSLAYSTDGFGTSHTIESPTANDGSYDWTVPDDPSTTARVRVASVVSPTIYDDSNADFAIISSTGVETYTFNAVITPTNATPPVTYNWSPEPYSGQGTASATYQWPPGTYDITLAATNCGGTFTDTRTVTVGSAGTALRSQVAAQQTMVFTSTADVILASDVLTNANLGGLEHLQTYYGDVEYRRSLMRWDLSALSGDITIDAATVELDRYHTYMENDTEIALYRVTSDWLEGTGNNFWPDASYVPDGATWLTATLTTPWTTPGGDYDATALDQLTISTGTAYGWIRLDATDAVQAWVGGSASNYGLLLRPLSGEWTDHHFYSREAVTETLRPRLVVTYTTGASAPTLDITAPTSGTRWPVSSTQQIEWNTTGTVSQVNLYYSLGDGFTLIESSVANTTGSNGYDWTTPPTATTSAQVRVESVVSPTEVYDVSDEFTLSDTGVSTHTIYLPLVLNDYTSQPSCPYPLTGVAISGPTIQGHRIYPANLIYKGAFAYPSGDEWAYSGHALAYYPDGDPTGPADSYPGSLYAAGHTNDDLVGEIIIPEPVISGNFDDLTKASVLQPLTDTTEGWISDCTYAGDCIYREVDGLEYLPNINKIAWNLRDWYNVTAYDQDSLGWSDLDMTGAQGVWHIGERPSDNNEFHNAKTCNYLFKAPESFADPYLDGKWLIAGNHREAGALGGSQGPTLYALAPWEDGSPPESEQNLDALALVYYPEIYPGCYDNPDECYFPDYRAMDNWGGGAWVQTVTGSAVLIFGRKGLGDNCYGTPEHCGGDPCEIYKGYHAYPYEPQILFYDPEELREVVAGTREPREVLPYEVYSPVDEVFDRECATFGAVAYDQEGGLMYVTEQEAGPWGETVVHVWEVRGDI
jgi:hypothetical protein